MLQKGYSGGKIVRDFFVYATQSEFGLRNVAPYWIRRFLGFEKKKIRWCFIKYIMIMIVKRRTASDNFPRNLSPRTRI